MSGMQMSIEVHVKRLKQYFVPACYTIFILGFFFFPSSKSISNFFYLAVAFPFVILVIMRKVDLRSLFFSRTLVLATIYLIYMFCTLFWADTFGLSDLLKYGRRVLYILIFISMTIHLIQSYPAFLQRLLILLCWTTAIVAAVNIFFFYRQYPFPDTRLFGLGLLDNPFKASSLFGIATIACIYLMLHQRSVAMRLLYLGLLLSSFAYMVLAQSRSSLLALVIAMMTWPFLVWMFHRDYRSNRPKTVMILAILVLMAVAGAAFFIVDPEFFRRAFLRGHSPHRLEVWRQILALVKEAPWFGHGLTADPRTLLSDGKILTHPHSVYVGTLFYGGIVGLLLFIALVLSALLHGFVRLKKPIHFMSATMVLYGALCMVAQGNMLIHHVKPFWLFFWFPVALLAAFELLNHSSHGNGEAPMQEVQQFRLEAESELF
jgi:O-antigen ligase